MEDDQPYTLRPDPHTVTETSMIGKSADSEMANDMDRMEIEQKSKIMDPEKPAHCPLSV